MGESRPELLVRELGDPVEKPEGDVLSDHRGGLQETLLVEGQAIDPGGQDRLDRGRHLDRLDRLGEPVGTAGPGQGPRLDEGPDALLQEEGIARGPLGQQRLERGQPRIASE